MDPIFYLIAGGGLLLFVVLLLWISGNQPKFIPDFPIQLAPRRWTKKQLYEIAKEHNIDGRSKMSRDRLLRVTTGLRPRTRPLKEEKPEIKPKKAFKLSGSDLIDYKKEGFHVVGKMGREVRDIKRLSPDVTFSGKFDPNTWTFTVEKQELKPSKRHLEKEVRLKKQQEYDEFLKKLPIGERKQYPVQQYIYERNLTKFGDGRLARYQKKLVTKEVVGIIETKPGVTVKKIETGQDKKIRDKKGYQVVITTLEKPAKDPFKPKKIRIPAIDMSQNTPEERIDALYKGDFPIKGATLKERRIAREAREMDEMYEQWGGALEAALERKGKQSWSEIQRRYKKKRPGIGKLTPFEKQLMKEKNLTPIEAKRLVERIELLGASRGDSADLHDISAMPVQDIEEIGKAVMEIEREQAMSDFIAESYAAEWAQHAPKQRFFPSINPNITFRVSRNNQKACYPINKPKKTKKKGVINNG